MRLNLTFQAAQLLTTLLIEEMARVSAAMTESNCDLEPLEARATLVDDIMNLIQVAK